MKGPAGVGKSAICQTCLERLNQLSVPCVGFFFTVNIREMPERFFPSIAYQLSTLFPKYADIVDKRIRRDRTLGRKVMQVQLQELIIKPFQELMKSDNNGGISGWIPIFVDGLDECNGTQAQCKIIELVAASIDESGSVPLLWAFFSRPEAHIEATFAQPRVLNKTHSVILPISRDVDGEIKMYLRAGF
jgi:hypothetical protein